MTSPDFVRMQDSVLELKRLYLDQALLTQTPTPDQQEFTRAFVVLAHAEFEFYIEKALESLFIVVQSNAAAGRFSGASLALLSYSGLESMSGGDSFSGASNAQRKIATRFGVALANYKTLISKNHGVREKYFAKMAIPLGLHGGHIDATWLSELDAFCTFRGAYGHMSRTDSRASHLAANPSDRWKQCHELIWGNPLLTKTALIGSFEDFDNWVDAEKNTFGPTASVALPSMRLERFKVALRRVRFALFGGGHP